MPSDFAQFNQPQILLCWQYSHRYPAVVLTAGNPRVDFRTAFLKGYEGNLTQDFNSQSHALPTVTLKAMEQILILQMTYPSCSLDDPSDVLWDGSYSEGFSTFGRSFGREHGESCEIEEWEQEQKIPLLI